MKRFIFLLTISFSCMTLAKEVETNSVKILNAPGWLKKIAVQEITGKIERKLEWSLRKIIVTWYPSQEALVSAFAKDAPDILAFTKKNDGSIHMGPRVTSTNFASVFGHELGHAIFAQKYKQAIPLWIEEGIVNSISGVNQIDYSWLLRQERIPLRSLQHPFDSPSQDKANYHYMATSAAVKMLESKCPSFRELLNLSLKSNLDVYIKSYCRIEDLDKTFWVWVKAKNQPK